MKKVICIIIVFIFSNNVYCQKKGLVYYGYIQSLNEGNMKGADSNAYLIFDKDRSYYVTAKDSLEKAVQTNQITVHEKGFEGKIEYSGKRSLQGDQVAYNVKEKKIHSNVFYDEQIYVVEPATPINWKITNETKKIGNFKCLKATAFFKGRNYTAWFTTAIPVSYGPWKLYGLPGLILEAYDTDKHVFWYFKTAEHPTKSTERVSFIKKSKNENIIKFVTLNEFKKFQTEKREQEIDFNRIMTQKLNGVTFEEPELEQLFIEF